MLLSTPPPAADGGSPSPREPRPRGVLFAAIGVIVATLVAATVAGCSTPPPPAAPVPASALQQAANRLTDAVLGQALRLRGAPPAFGSWPREIVEVVPIVDARERQPSVAGQQTTRWIAEQIARQHPAYGVKDADAAVPRWRLVGTLVPEEAADGAATAAAEGGRHPYTLSLALVDAGTGEVIATARERVADPLLDASFEASRRARATPPPSPATPPRATAEAPPPPDPLEGLRADYLALLRQGREAEAQTVFGRMLAIGLNRRTVAMKLLFAPGSTDFWPDPELARRYPGWLAELAQQAYVSPYCLRIVGHASSTGSDAFNRQLSLRRAQAVRQIMLRSLPELAPKLAVVGRGESQTVVGGSGDDQRNAPDRRVEFEVVDCPPSP